MVETSCFNAGVASLIPGQGVKIPHVPQPKKQQNIKQKQYWNKFNKDLKNDPHQKIFKRKKKSFNILSAVRYLKNSNNKEKLVPSFKKRVEVSLEKWLSPGLGKEIYNFIRRSYGAEK